MNTLIRTTLAATILLALFVTAVSASHFWSIDVSTPRSITNQNQVQLDYTTLSTDGSDTTEVRLYRNGSFVLEQVTTGGGDSGRLIAPLPVDGTYELEVRAKSALHGDTVTTTRTVTRDTVAPSAPVYLGANRSGNQYTVSFRAADSDTYRIYLFSSTRSSFVASEGTLVDSVDATGSTQQITYTTSSNAPRFHAVVAIDRAGNISRATGDDQTDFTIIDEGVIPAPEITPATAVPGTDGAPGDGTQTGDGTTPGDDGEDVLGAEDDTGTDGDSEGEVAGETDEAAATWLWLLLLLAAAGGGYYYFRKLPANS